MTALVFDCDGVLADTERHGHLPAFNQAFAFQQYNYSAAISFLLGAVVFVGSYLFLFVNRRRSSLH